VVGDDLVVDNIHYATYPIGSVPLTSVQVQTMANSCLTAWRSVFLPLMSNFAGHESTTVTDLDTVTGFEQTDSPGTADGTVTTGPSPAASSMVVSMRTALRGRSFRGRQYMSGLPIASMLDPQKWTPAAVASYDAAWISYLGTLAGLAIPLTLSVVSFYSGTDHTIPGHRPKPIRRVVPIATTITLTNADQRIGSQRRRNA
jgi:hypothetical protein